MNKDPLFGYANADEVLAHLRYKVKWKGLDVEEYYQVAVEFGDLEH